MENKLSSYLEQFENYFKENNNIQAPKSETEESVDTLVLEEGDEAEMKGDLDSVIADFSNSDKVDAIKKLIKSLDESTDDEDEFSEMLSSVQEVLDSYKEEGETKEEDEEEEDEEEEEEEDEDLEEEPDDEE